MKHFHVERRLLTVLIDIHRSHLIQAFHRHIHFNITVIILISSHHPRYLPPTHICEHVSHSLSFVYQVSSHRR